MAAAPRRLEISDHVPLALRILILAVAAGWAAMIVGFLSREEPIGDGPLAAVGLALVGALVFLFFVGYAVGSRHAVIDREKGTVTTFWHLLGPRWARSTPLDRYDRIVVRFVLGYRTRGYFIELRGADAEVRIYRSAFAKGTAENARALETLLGWPVADEAGILR
jgi:hypothetical protein